MKSQRLASGAPGAVFRATFAGNLRRRREDLGLTQEELAHRAGLHMTDVGRIERAERDPGIRTVAKLAQGLGVPATELVEGIDTR